MNADLLDGRAYSRTVSETLWRLMPGQSEPISDRELLRTVREFRRGILGRRPSHRMCFAVSAPLAGFLSVFGVECELVEGCVGDWEHFWLQLPDGRALDPTADQFNGEGHPPLPAVYLGPPAWIHVEVRPSGAEGSGDAE